MGLFGFGKDDAQVAKDQLAQTRSALEQAQAGPQDQGFVGNSAAKMVENLLDTGIDGKGPFDSAASVAASALKKNGGDVEAAVDDVVKSHLKLAAAGGFVTSLGGFITLPVALPANVLGFYLLATRMTAAVASLRGHDLTRRRSAPPSSSRSWVPTPTTCSPRRAWSRRPAASPTSPPSGCPARPSWSSTRPSASACSRRPARRRSAASGATCPLVGGVVGAGLDGWLIKRISENARREFPTATAQIAGA